MSKLKLMLASALVVAGVGGAALAQGGDSQDRTAKHQRFAEKKKAMLEKFDTNKNGVLEPAEKEAMHSARAAEKFAKMDTNGDGKLSLEEFKAGKGGFGHRGKRGMHGPH